MGASHDMSAFVTPASHARSAQQRRWRAGWSILIALAAFLVGVSAPKQSNAQENPTPEDALVDAQQKYARARSTPSGQLGAYLALHEMWSAWPKMNPLLVEQALILAAEDTTKPAPVRHYARRLIAYARLRRGDIQSAQDFFQHSGYVTDWLVVGPFDNEGKSGLAQLFGPDDHPEEPIIPGRAYSGKERPVRYRKLPLVFKYGWVDLGNVFRPTSHICGHLTTFVYGTKDGDATSARPITLWMGSDGAHRVIFNGQVVIEEEAYRGFDTGRYAAAVTLRPGKNRLSVKVCGEDSSPLFSLRLADERGETDPSLRVSSDLLASEEARENVLSAQNAALPQLGRGLDPPMQVVLDLAEDKNARAGDLELAARYLVETRGDDPTTHQARNLATLAAEKKTNVALQLLLVDLAEDRNAAETALQVAEQLAPENDVEVLLARAAQLGTGPSPQDAFPVYDRILAIDPDNLVALQGRVELYNRAGLRRTALRTLEEAYVRRPHSVLLSNMVSSQRKALGLVTLAQEAEDQYASLRFDDTTVLSDRLELALARRDRKSALHFLSRIRMSDPQSLWTYRLSARVHRALGNEKRALLDLEQGLDIAPEDINILKGLADHKGRMGARDEQLALLRKILELRPQEVEVRKYVDHIAPPEIPQDEKYARSAEEFLKHRYAAADGHPRRTLQDLTVSTVYENGLSRQFRQVVFQPLTDAAAATSRQYAFQYQADQQRVELKGAKVYRSDGSIDEAIESGEGAANDPSISMYTSARTFYVQFPRLEPGDVVELRYRIDDITPRNEFADYYGDIVYMQSDEPIAHAEYVLVAPKSRTINIDKQVTGLEETVTTSGNQRTFRFVADQVPPIMPEQGMPPWSEVLGFVHVSTYSSWNDLGKWYWGLVRDQLDLDAETRKTLREIVKGKTTTEEKVKAVYAWVTKNTRYVALEFGIYGFKPRRCVQTVNRGWGDCKDKATVIVTFLRELGIDANLVILRTQMRGDFRSRLPSLAPFDHAIAYVPELDLYLDGTAERTGIDELPVMDRKALGLLVLDGKAKLVRLPGADPMKNVVERDLDVRLGKDGSATVKFEYDVSGHAAPGFRTRYGSDSNRKDRLANDLGSEFPGLQIDENSIKTNDFSDAEQDVELALSGKSPQFARREGTAMSLPVTVQTRLTPRYAALSSRKLDVMITGFSTQRQTVTITLPPGAQVEAAPPETQVQSRFGKYHVHYEKKGQTITVESSLLLEVDRVDPKDYAEFRTFCVAADQALSHRLVVTP